MCKIGRFTGGKLHFGSVETKMMQFSPPFRSARFLAIFWKCCGRNIGFVCQKNRDKVLHDGIIIRVV